MKPLDPPEFYKVYQLVKRTGLLMTNIGTSTGTAALGTGFFNTQHDAEMQRTMELLKLTSTDNSEFFVFELELPNPVYQKEKHNGN